MEKFAKLHIFCQLFIIIMKKSCNFVRLIKKT